MSGPTPDPGASPAAPSNAEVKQALQRLADLPDDDFDLADTALMLAALERPRVPLDRYRHHLHDLSEAVAREATRRRGDLASLDAHAAALLGVIAGELGYQGDDLTYDDLQNANLMRVIDRRKGLPVALGILYIHAARAQGWTAYGLNFPAHFLIAIEADGARAIIDPFAARRLDGANQLRAFLKAVAGDAAELSPQHCAPLGNRAVLLRLQNNIKARLAAQGRSDRAAAVLDRMLLFAPGEADLWREAGALHAQAGNLRAAIAALEHYLTVAHEPVARHSAAQLLQQLRQRLN
jgi:regulator of sirC expression with transglutaminase-like and TPR domain